MALPKQNVAKVVELLSKLVPTAIRHRREPNEEFPEGDLLVLNDKKGDGGYESVFLRLVNPSKNTIEIFNQEIKDQIKGNSSMCYQSKYGNDKGKNIWHLGWF